MEFDIDFSIEYDARGLSTIIPHTDAINDDDIRAIIGNDAEYVVRGLAIDGYNER
ncbi:MAG: hypothetical protein GY803_08050 [Chloroflexi bacterium]|nr:hypothetical protein [Chloroflexota bacterium]